VAVTVAQGHKSNLFGHELDGLCLTFVGEGTNLCRSRCELTTIPDLTMTQVCPPRWELPLSTRRAGIGQGQRRC
jgi:hypothetical protein